MSNVVFLVFRKNDDIVEVYQAPLPSYSAEYDIKRTLKGCRGVPQPKQHTQMAKGAHVRDERRLVPVLRCDRDLPLTAVTVER